MYKPHRLLVNRASGYVAEASAYLRRRRAARRPFVRLYWSGGAGASSGSGAGTSSLDGESPGAQTR